ncbi:GAD-like domain-containing protein [Pseudomonas sp. Z3-8]|uniref:GAD-like domain-containing protein n=1 Tax=Pseudomonas sp. Z3-8 TaxID=2817412 RepID=UPI003DA981F5
MSKLINFIIEANGAPKKIAHLTQEELSQLPTTLPNCLFELYQSHGRFTLQDGRLQTCHPIDFKGLLSIIFANDQVFNKDNCHAFAYSAFGTLYFYHDLYGCGEIDLINGHLYSANLTSPPKTTSNLENTIYLPFALDCESLDFFDIEDAPLFSRAKRKLGPLEVGECYGFFPALSMAGLAHIDNLKRVKAIEHLSIISQTQELHLIDSTGYGASNIIRKIGK